ncbi:MAG: hypothetical protein JRC89_11035 [Deltaproteobacteria bacterium]|nr:hypothetical protein [Deltaproteobacteria bacterium]
MDITAEYLNGLGDEKFERLVKTLLFKVIGKGITPFSKGKDGAREATFKGRAPYPSESDKWSGHWIFQVKYTDIGNGIKQARERVKYLIDSELRKLTDYGYFEANKCDNYIYIVNVPFSGTAKTGLHDYIGAKKKQYKVKNFDYWDSEKVCRYLDAYPDVKTTFFPCNGILSVDQDEINRIREVYVPPSQYHLLKSDLLKKSIISITGQPHVGKTTSSLYMADELYQELGLNNILVVPIIDDLIQIPKIANSVIVFDDLFGETKYHSINKKSKVISSLLKGNYIILTSRNHIFADAKKAGELNEYIEENENTLIQEGSYSTDTLKNILSKHLYRKLRLGFISKTSFDFVMLHEDMVVNALRFPHNIAVFVDELHECSSKKRLKNLVERSKRIESVAISWMNAFDDNDISILAALSLGGTLEIDHGLQLFDNLDEKDFRSFIRKSDKLIAFEGAEIRFRHPSYRTAYYKYFKEKEKDKSHQIVIALLSDERLPLSFKKKYSVILQEIIKELDTVILIRILETKNITVDAQQLIKRMPERVVDFCVRQNQKRRRWRVPKSLIKSKDFLKKKDIMTFIEGLFSLREKSHQAFIDSLILYFSCGIRHDLDPFIEKLKGDSTDQIRLKLGLLGSKGSLIGEEVLPAIFKYFNHNNAKVRRKAYSAFNSVSFEGKHGVGKHREYMVQSYNRETNARNKARLHRIIDRIDRK